MKGLIGVASADKSNVETWRPSVSATVLLIIVPIGALGQSRYPAQSGLPAAYPFSPQLADELLVKDITEPSAILATLSDDELQTAYDHVVEQFALALLVGADRNSQWRDGNLVVAANHRNIHLLQAVFYAVRLELQRRKLG